MPGVPGITSRSCGPTWYLTRTTHRAKCCTSVSAAAWWNGEYQWKQASNADALCRRTPARRHRGFHLNTLASTFCSWKEIVQKFLVAKEQLDQGNPEGMKVWVNTELGETWEEQGEQVEDAALRTGGSCTTQTYPEGVAGADSRCRRAGRPLRGGGGRLGHWQGELGYPLSEDIRRYAERAGMARPRQFPVGGLQEKRRDGVAHHERLHRHRRSPHRSGIPASRRNGGSERYGRSRARAVRTCRISEIPPPTTA